MPRYGNPLTKQELAMFRKNYKFMWTKLGFSYYSVLKAKSENCPVSEDIAKLMPSPAVCSKCQNDKSYSPSRGVVQRIVDFYNAVLHPEIDAFQFLSEDLGKTNAMRYKNSESCDPRFIGTYAGFYPSGSENITLGSYIKIFEEQGRLRLVAIMGMRSDEQMANPRLLDTINLDRPRRSNFEAFQKESPEDGDEQRYSYFEGTIDLTEKSFCAYLKSNDIYQRKLCMMLDLTPFRPSNPDRPLFCGIALMLSSNDGAFSASFYQLCFARTEYFKISLAEPELSSFTRPTVTDKNSVVFDANRDRDWYVFAMNHRKSGTT